MSSVILLVVVTGLMSALDVQTSASGKARAGSVAAALAEADQERLRSFRVPQLSNRQETRTETISGAKYKVESKGEWIRDDTGGTQSCANVSSEADYLRLTSTVTGRPDQAPIQVRSLIAPPVGQFGAAHGTVAVKVVGAAGQPQPNITTTITGPETSWLSTNELGCAVFGYVPVGAYGVSVSALGFVNPSGDASATGSATATEGTVNLTSLSYDRAGSIAVGFQTTDAQGNPVPTTSSTLSVANSGVPGTGVRSYPFATPAAAITANGLFPFTAPYTVYAGSCSAANPARYDDPLSDDPPYFDTHEGSVILAPGASRTATVNKPRLSFGSIRAAANTPVVVQVRATDPTCTDTYDRPLVTDGDGYATLPPTAMPFGTYRVCVAVSGRYRQADVALKTTAGAAAPALDVRLSTNPPSVSCLK